VIGGMRRCVAAAMAALVMVLTLGLVRANFTGAPAAADGGPSAVGAPVALLILSPVAAPVLLARLRRSAKE